VITVSKINSQKIVINCELIESLEGGVDTVITLSTGKKLVVMDSPVEIIEKVITFRRAINSPGLDVHFSPYAVEETETVPE
jgi:flagellar protein FlbD